MATRLQLAPGLALPADEAVTRSFGVLGMRGAGKSNAAVVLAEEMFRAGIHWVTIDPKGDWWGVRSSTDGKAAGLPVVIFGGEHQDVALTPSAQAGVQLADVILGETLTCVVDLSEFSKREKIEFLAGVGAREGFAERLFRKKKRDAEPLHIFMDEAHDYVPQQAKGDVAKLIDVVSKWQTMGRQRGMGVSVLSQRSARVHKDVLTQVDVLIALRTIGPQDRDAIKAWLQYHSQSEEILASLATLGDGEAWVWSPEWLGQTKRVQFRRRRTYDSGATPTRGASGRRPATLADVDLSALAEQMASAIAAAKAADPKELKKRIRELEELVRGAEARANIERPEPERVEVPVPVPVEPDLSKAWAKLAEIDAGVESVRALLEVALDEARKKAGQDRQRTVVPLPVRSTTQSTRPAPNARQRPVQPPEPRSERPARPDSGRIDPDGLSGPARKILDSIAWWNVIGYEQPSKQQVGIIAGYRVGKRIGGHYGNLLGSLRSAGLIDYPTDGRVILTGEGRAHADVADVATSTAALQAEVFSRCSGPERRILEALVEVYPDELSKQELGERAGYSVGDRVGGHFGNLLGKLRTLGLIDYPSAGTAAADPVLFLEGR